MSIKVISTALCIFVLVAACKAQSTNGSQFHGKGVALSISITNNNCAVGSYIAIFAEVQNKSTNDVRLGSFIVLMTSHSGKTYQLTAPMLDDSRNLGDNIVKTGGVHNWVLHVGLNHYFEPPGIKEVDENLEPGFYILKAVQYYDGDKLSIQSNFLQVQIK